MNKMTTNSPGIIIEGLWDNSGDGASGLYPTDGLTGTGGCGKTQNAYDIGDPFYPTTGRAR